MIAFDAVVQTLCFFVVMITCMVAAVAITACIVWAWTYVTERWFKR